MKKYLLLAMTLASTNLLADTVLGVYAGVQSWYYDNSGDISSPFDSSIFNGDYDINNESALSYYIALEHAVPMLPNFKLKHTSMNDQFNNNLDVCLPDPTISCSREVDINLSHTDFTAYYELLDNWVNLDLGLSALYFTGDSELVTTLNVVSENYSEFIPALYGKAEFEFPTTDLSASLTANVGTLTDNSIVDLELAIKYKFALGFGLEAGLRKQTVEFEDFSNITVDSTATGVFAALNFHF